MFTCSKKLWDILGAKSEPLDPEAHPRQLAGTVELGGGLPWSGPPWLGWELRSCRMNSILEEAGQFPDSSELGGPR